VRALGWIAERSLDTGNAETARVAFSRVTAEGGAPATTLFKYALAAQAAERPAEARSILERILKEAPNAPLKLAGQQVTAGAAAQQMIDRLAAAPAAPAAWPSFGGPNGDRRMPALTSANWRQVWEYTYPSGSLASGSPAQRVQIITGGQGMPGGRYRFLGFPVADRDRLYLQGPRSMAAVNLSDGQAAWTNEEFTAPSADPNQPRIFRGGMRGGSYGRSPQSQGIPTLDGGLLALRTPLLTNSGYGRSDYLMVAIDARSGKQLWRKTAESDPEGIFYNAPAVRDNTLFTGIAAGLAGITEYRAVAMEAGTGDTLWSSYLGGGSDVANSIDGSPPVLRDGVVWIESSLHTLNALDMITGEIRTIYKYLPRPRNAFGAMDGYALANEPVSLLPGAGPMVFSSRWGDQVVAIDPATYKLLWSAPKGSANSLFAVDKQSAYLAGTTEMAAFELETGLKRWVRPSPGPSYSTGYAAMVGDRLAWLTEGKLAFFDPATGNPTGSIDLGENVAQTAQNGTLLVVGNRLLVCLPQKVFAFEPAG
jgi:outer membrane protein assembly factor BamB